LQQIAAGPQYAGRFATTIVEIVAGHRRQQSATFLPRAFVAVRESVERVAVLRIKEHQRCAAIRQGLQQHERIATLCWIPRKI
jgi:hypothetical protein